MDQMYHSLKKLRYRLAALTGQCFKIPYESHAAAEAAARRVQYHSRGYRRAYHCDRCGNWHLTSRESWD